MQEREIKLRVITAALPRSIHGVSAKDGDTFIVLINETDTPERQQQAFYMRRGTFGDAITTGRAQTLGR